MPARVIPERDRTPPPVAVSCRSSLHRSRVACSCCCLVFEPGHELIQALPQEYAAGRRSDRAQHAGSRAAHKPWSGRFQDAGGILRHTGAAGIPLSVLPPSRRPPCCRKILGGIAARRLASASASASAAGRRQRAAAAGRGPCGPGRRGDRLPGVAGRVGCRNTERAQQPLFAVGAVVGQGLAGPLAGGQHPPPGVAEVIGVVGLALAPAGDQAGPGVLGLDAVPEPVRAPRRARLEPQRLGQPGGMVLCGAVSAWWQSPICLVRYLVR